MEIIIVLALVVWLVLALRSIRKNGAGCGGYNGGGGGGLPQRAAVFAQYLADKEGDHNH